MLNVTIMLMTLAAGADANSSPTLPAAFAQAEAAAITAMQSGGSPNVGLTKSCPPLRYLGRDATFEITVTNSGGGDALNVVVSDELPAGLDFVSADNKGQKEGSNLVWRLGTLAAGQSRTVSATFHCNRVGDFLNAARVSYCAEARDQCRLEVKGKAAVLLECVDSPDPIEVGGNVTYTIAVLNQGSAVGTNVRIKCTLPAELEYVSSGGATDATANGNSVDFAPLATLAPQATATFKVIVRGVAPGDARFHVEMITDQLETPVMETESTHVY